MREKGGWTLPIATLQSVIVNAPPLR